MHSLEFVNFEIKDGLAVITLNRPEKYNCFIRPMALSVQYALDECAHKVEVRAVIITGAGKAFSAGQDLNEVTGKHSISVPKILAEHLNPIVRRIRELEKPIVAAVNGVAAGAGANIALSADLTIAKESASFIQAFSKIGLIPDSGGTFFLPRLVGIQRANAMMMLGDKVSAKKAEDIGLIYKAVADDEFEEYYLGVAKKLVAMPTRALGLTKKAINSSMENTLLLQLALEDQLQAEASRTQDFEEGVNAFIEKRKAIFKGK